MFIGISNFNCVRHRSKKIVYSVEEFQLFLNEHYYCLRLISLNEEEVRLYKQANSLKQ